MADEPKPLTDEDLAACETITWQWADFFQRHPDVDRDIAAITSPGRLYGLPLISPEVVGRLVAEVRRLRAQVATDDVTTFSEERRRLRCRACGQERDGGLVNPGSIPCGR